MCVHRLVVEELCVSLPYTKHKSSLFYLNVKYEVQYFHIFIWENAVSVVSLSFFKESSNVSLSKRISVAEICQFSQKENFLFQKVAL